MINLVIEVGAVMTKMQGKGVKKDGNKRSMRRRQTLRLIKRNFKKISLGKICITAE